LKHPDAETKLYVPEAFQPLLEDIRQLKKDCDNPNRMTNKEREKVWRSLLKFGWFKPILADENGLLGDGEQRLEALLAHEEYYAPVLRLGVDDVDRRLLRQVANKLHGVHDPTLDALEYRRIDEGGGRGELIKLLQLSERELLKALGDRVPEENYRIPALEAVETDIQLGDKFQLGDHVLMCGDSCKKEHVDALLQNVTVNLVNTDPPYGVYADWGDSLRRRKDTASGSIYNDDIPDYEKFSKNWLGNLKPHLAEYNAVYIWINCAHMRELMNAAHELGFKLNTEIIWVKNHFVISNIDYKSQHENCLYGWLGKHRFYGDNNERTIWKYPRPTRSELHPTMKPVEMMARAISNSSILGDTVLDLFGGSGSTLIACEQLERRCYMTEIDPRYCQIILDRWHAYTGMKPRRL